MLDKDENVNEETPEGVVDEADRVGAMIREQLGDRPLPDLDELIDGGRDERDDRILARPR